MLKNFSIYNTQNKKVEQVVPVEPGKIGLYVCGVTPYELSHIGHARVAVVYDTLVRFLRNVGWQVKHVQNYTDVDDKIIKKSIERGMEPLTLAEENIQAYEQDMLALNVNTPDVQPKVSTHIQEIIEFVQKLEEKGFAYTHANGDVMFDTAKFENYGCLSHRNLDEQIAGIRISDEGKKNPEDFVLWKMEKDSENISWDSPWGKGRPGWHIECSAMSCKHLGTKFDIHGGGLDVLFPHHENEVAQSDACHSHKSVNYWMHIALIKIDNEKMSKSLGNFFTIREVLNDFSGAVIRLFLLSTHYNTSLNFSKQALEQSKNGLERLQNTALRAKKVITGDVDFDRMESFYDKLANNLNTPMAIADLFEVAKEINIVLDNNGDASDLKATMLQMAEILGLKLEQEKSNLSEDIKQQVESLKQARADKNWAEADKLRDDLQSSGYDVQYHKDGSINVVKK